MNHTFSDLIDTQLLQKFMDSFYEVTGILYAILDTKNNILISGGWQDICTKFHRICPQTEYTCKQSDSYIFKYLFKKRFIGYKCLNGLMDYATPIIVEGRHLATIFTGQFLHEPPDEEFFRQQAREYGFDETTYIEALRRVPIISTEQAEFIMTLYSHLAHLLAAMGIERLRQLDAVDKTLKEQEERLRLVLEGTHDGFWDYNIESGEVYYSLRWIEMLGYSLDEIEPQIYSWQRLIHPDDKPVVMKQLNNHFEGYTDRYETEHRLLTKSGEWKWILDRGKVVTRDTQGRPLRMAGTHLDITERKRVEKALRLSEDRFSKAFNANPSPMTISTLDEGRFIVVNDSFLKMFRYEREDVISLTSFDLCIWARIEERGKIIQLLKTQGTVRNIETELRTKTGKLCTVLFSAETIDFNGEQYMLSVVNDITQRKQLEKEMVRLDRLNLVGQMAAGIAHEIRNPMTTVRGFLQMFACNENFKEQKEIFDVMISELDRANSIITEFLSLAKNKVVDRKPLNLNLVLKNLFPLLQGEALKDDKYIIMELGKIPDLLLNEGEIRQVILNLVRNGLDAMPPSSSLSIKTYTEDSEVILSVRDQGKGMEQGVIEKIGIPFFTTKDNGTGLGLAMCYNIAVKHNANIKFETNSCGTTFFVRFKLPS